MKSKYTRLCLLLFIIEVCLCIRLIYVLFCPPVAHIYVDPATTPALFQMMDLVDQSHSDPKYVAWRRYTVFFRNKLKTRLNVTPSSVKPYTSNKDFVQLITNEINSFYRQHPGYVFVIHANVEHPWFLNPILKVIPKNQIKHIYLYEDSIGRTIWEGISSHFWPVFLKYPTTYRLSYIDHLLTKFPRSKTFFQEVMISDIEKLSQRERKLLYALTGLDRESIAHLFRNKPIGIFFDDCNLKADEVAPFFEQKVVMDSRFQKITWLYKNHPRCPQKGPFWEKLKKYAPDAHTLPPKMPYEILIMAGLNPDYVAGYSSSVFFSVQPEQVLCYIERPKDTYLSVLKNMGIISDENIIFQQDMKNHIQ